MKMHILLLFAVILFSLVSCQNKVKGPENEDIAEQTYAPPTADNSQTSLDWQGTYQGVTPCGDCAGIETFVLLNNDLTYKLSMKYLGKSDALEEYAGTFSWDNAGSKITLSGVPGTTLMYLVGENKLFQLDQQGNRITGDLATKYELVKKP